MSARRFFVGAAFPLGNWKYCLCCHHSLVVYLTMCFGRWHPKAHCSHGAEPPSGSSFPRMLTHFLCHCHPACYHAGSRKRQNASCIQRAASTGVPYRSTHQATENVPHSPRLLYLPTILKHRKTCSTQPLLQETNIRCGGKDKNHLRETSCNSANRPTDITEDSPGTPQQKFMCCQETPKSESAQLNRQLAQNNRVYGVNSDFVAMVGITHWPDSRTQLEAKQKSSWPH